MDVDLLFKSIGPIGVLPMPIPILPIELSFHFLSLLCFVAIGLIMGLLINKISKCKWQKTHNLNIILPVIVSTLLYFVSGISMISVKGLILFMLLLYASLSDIYKREVSDWVSISIAITGLIGVNLSEIPFMLIAAVIVTIPQLLIAISKEGSYGGADIKIMAACSFVLGLQGSFVAIILGLGLGVLSTVIKRKIKKESINEKFPIVPWLAFDSFFVFVLS